jgi:hypothetical protein
VDLKGDFSNRVLETLEEWDRVLEGTSLGREEALERNPEHARKPDI